MCKNANELMSLFDEMAASAASMHTGSQNYDNFIRTRDICKDKIQALFAKNHILTKAIENLHHLIST